MLDSRFCENDDAGSCCRNLHGLYFLPDSNIYKFVTRAWTLEVSLKEIIMAKQERLAIAAACGAKESTFQRSLRIQDSANGTTLRTRVIKNKKAYSRNLKHKKSFASAEDFAFIKSDFPLRFHYSIYVKPFKEAA